MTRLAASVKGGSLAGPGFSTAEALFRIETVIVVGIEESRKIHVVRHLDPEVGFETRWTGKPGGFGFFALHEQRGDFGPRIAIAVKTYVMGEIVARQGGPHLPDGQGITAGDNLVLEDLG